jgi:adenine/guanine phosphoribosyltransferase-like PRPP-binding protein
MFPSQPQTAHPATRLWQVERDGNPLRRFGHVSPFIGKLAPVCSTRLDQIGQLTRFALPDLPEPTLVIGMTESSLLLAFFMARWQQKPVDLRFTTRKSRETSGHVIAFREPHSHGPQHFLALEVDRRYAQIVIIEDELTTGATLRNLILALREVSNRVFVATLRDLRPPEMRVELEMEMRNAGTELEVLSMESLVWTEDAVVEAPVAPHFNPFGRTEDALQGALTALRDELQSFQPDGLFMIGECVDVALRLWLQLPETDRIPLRQITRSPWKIDGESVNSVTKFPAIGGSSNYFLYNFEPGTIRRALWIAENANAAVGAQVSEFFAENGIEARGIVVAGT